MKPINPLTEMEKKAKRIKRIQLISNTILANGCYHDKEMEHQINNAEKRGNISEFETEVICKAWSLRNNLAKELMKELEEYINNENKKTII